MSRWKGWGEEDGVKEVLASESVGLCAAQHKVWRKTFGSRKWCKSKQSKRFMTSFLLWLRIRLVATLRQFGHR